MKRLPVAVLFTLLAACQSTGEEYPTLAIRDVERVSGTLQPPAPYVPPPQPPEVSDRLARLSAEVASAHDVFQREAPAARNLVEAARGSGIGSEAWAVAQVALAGLESARSRAMIALADLDRLYVDAATEGTELGRIATARDGAIAQVEQENATITSLLGLLG